MSVGWQEPGDGEAGDSSEASAASATVTIGLALVIAVVLTLIASAVSLGVLAAVLDLSPLGVFFYAVLIVPMVVLVSIFVSLKFVFRLLPQSPNHESTKRTVLIGALLMVFLVTLGAVVSIDRTGSDPSAFGVPFAAAIVIGLVTVTATLFYSWHRTPTRAAVALGLGGFFVVLIGLAALPGALLAADPYRHLPVVVVDEASAANAGWSVSSFRDHAPNFVEIIIRDDFDRSTRIWIDHFSVRCDGSDCALDQRVAAGPIQISQRPCLPERFTIPEVFIELGRGSLTVNSNAFRSACSDKPPDLTVDELLTVADLVRPASPEEFQQFATDHS